MATKKLSKTVSRAYLNKVKAELKRTRENWLREADRAEAYEQGLQEYGIDPEEVWADFVEWMGLDEDEDEDEN